jgi:NAD(P)H-dependent FMN reductase
VLAAVAAAKELPQLGLLDALELTLLIARKDPRRHQRVAARWLLRLLEEHPDVTIEEAGLAVSCLIALLPGARYQEAVQTLRAIAERATRRRPAQGVG